MAQADVQNILEGLKQHTEKLFRTRALEIEQQRADAQQEAEKARIEQEKNVLEQHKKEFDLTHDLAKKAADIMHARNLQEVGKTYQETGIAPPNASFSPTASSVPGGEANFTPVNPQQATGQMMNIPDVGSFQVATPEQAATRQANLARITQAPAEEAKTREELSKQKEMQDRVIAAKKEDFQRTQEAKEQDFIREMQREQGAKELEKLRSATQISVAKIQAASRNQNQVEGVDTAPLIHSAVNGDMSQEELNKLPISKQDKAMVVNGVLNAGGRFYSQAQKDAMAGFTPAIKAVTNMDDFIANQPNTTNWLSAQAGGALTAFDSKLNNLQEMIKSDTMAIAKTIQGAKGQRIMNLELQLAQGGFVPKRNQTLAENVKRRNIYVQNLQDIVKANLSGLPANVIQAKMKDLGILDIPMLDPKTGQPVGGAQQQVTPQQPGQLSPAALELLKKHGIQ